METCHHQKLVSMQPRHLPCSEWETKMGQQLRESAIGAAKWQQKEEVQLLASKVIRIEVGTARGGGRPTLTHLQSLQLQSNVVLLAPNHGCHLLCLPKLHVSLVALTGAVSGCPTLCNFVDLGLQYVGLQAACDAGTFKLI